MKLMQDFERNLRRQFDYFHVFDLKAFEGIYEWERWSDNIVRMVLEMLDLAYRIGRREGRKENG